ncbi:sensor of ECF-type sigma factor [Flavobacterium sp.]|uniref:sensor of ECF-type sigma factor n=1 Tax=Flavobacterium sp. TaxID=239 RepID=UPI003BC9577B
MKNYLLFIVSLFLTSIFSFGQNGPLREHFKQKKEKIKALKVAFITTELDLTSDEAVKFWPIYNAFEDKQQEIKKQKFKAYLERTDANLIDKLSEKDAASLLTQMESNEDDLFQLKKKFISSLKGVLPSNKILKLKKAEEKFSKKLLQQYRDKKNNR